MLRESTSFLTHPFRSCLVLALGVVSCSKASCGPQDGAQDGAQAGPGVTIDLLGRRPDEQFHLPAEIVPEGDVPEMATWGASEGPGWSQKDFKLANGVHYRETNQARASLILPATRPVEREIELALWCTRALGSEPARVEVQLNGVVLSGPGLLLGREPGLVRVHAPQAAWRLGPNQLELAPLHGPDGRAWDTLALARVVYGSEARVELDVVARTARLAPSTGLRYALELARPARLTLAGRAPGGGKLCARTGELDLGTGEVRMDPEESVFEARDGLLRGQLALTRRAGAVRVLDLEWSAAEGSALELDILQAHEDASAPRPPIVFVSIDTFAAQHLSLYGYGRATTPELQRLQADAVIFDQCLANAPWTLPSYLSVMSGLYPRSHWVDLAFPKEGASPTPFDQWSLAPNRWTLAEALRARGYRTAGFVDTWWLSQQTGVGQGFDAYDGQAALAPFSDMHAGIELIVGKLLPPWFDTLGPGSPPFLFLHALDAHGPYLPEEPFRDTFLAALPEPGTWVATGSDNETYRTIPYWMGLTLVPDETVPLPEKQPVEALVARYDETLLKVDAYLGELVELLRARGLYEDCVLVVTGDHGEYFGPGAYGHGIMREAVLHVPLLVKLPHSAHGGSRVRHPVALVDVYPTLLELAGIPAAPERLHGKSLLARLGPERAPESARAHFSEGGHVEQYALTLDKWRLVEERPGSESSEASLLTHPRVPDEWLREHCPELLTLPLTRTRLSELLVRDGFREALRELRGLVAGPYYSLYDREADPGDLHDLAATQPEEVERLKGLLEIEKARSRAARKEAKAVVPPTLSPEALQALDALGY